MAGAARATSKAVDSNGRSNADSNVAESCREPRPEAVDDSGWLHLLQRCDNDKCSRSEANGVAVEDDHPHSLSAPAGSIRPSGRVMDLGLHLFVHAVAAGGTLWLCGYFFLL